MSLRGLFQWLRKPSPETIISLFVKKGHLPMKKRIIIPIVGVAAAVAVALGVKYYRDEQEKKHIALMQEQAVEVDSEISDIADIDLADGDAIAKAESDYAALSDEAQGYVTKYATLTNAREEYDKLKAQDEKDQADAKTVDDAICAIGTVTLDSGDAITAARTGYDGLSDAAKGYVTKLDVLTQAETDYNAQVVAKQEADKKAAEEAAKAEAAKKAQQSAKAAKSSSSTTSSSGTTRKKEYEGEPNEWGLRHAKGGGYYGEDIEALGYHKWYSEETGKYYDVDATGALKDDEVAQYFQDMRDAGYTFSLGD